MAKIILPDIKDLENYNNQELLKLIRTMEKRLRSREAALEKAGLSEFSNFGGVSPRGFKFSTKQAQKADSTRRILIARYKKLKAALDNPRNTIKGAKRRRLETTGENGQTRYKLIMDELTESERDRVRETYASDEVFEIGDIISDEGVDFKEAEEIYNERIAEEVDDLLNGI